MSKSINLSNMNNLGMFLEWISIIGGSISVLITIVLSIAKLLGKNLIDEWFERRNKKYQVQLDKELAEYKSKLDSKLEILKISYGNVFSERMVIFKEACVRMQETEKLCNRLASYKNYDCKDNVNFEKPCKSECPNECIVNYTKVVFEMRNYLVETIYWFESNEFFFSLDQYCELLKAYKEFLELLDKANNIIMDLSISEKERAYRCFDIFAEFNMDKYDKARNKLIDSFRYTLNIPIMSKGE